MRGLSYGGVLRRARRHADLSQRELAEKAGVDRSVISRIEAARQCPSVATLERLLGAMGFVLQVVSSDGRHVIDSRASWWDEKATRDGAGRRFPAHLDVRSPNRRRPWWYEFHTCAPVEPPLLTFNLSRFMRDWYRREDNRTACDPDERVAWGYEQSRVHIPGYRPKSLYGGGTAFW